MAGHRRRTLRRPEPSGRDLNAPDFAPALGDYLRAELGLTGPLHIAPVGGQGQSNPTYFVDVGATQLVLRKQPVGPLLPSAHAVDREFRVLSALHGSALPVPRPLCFHAGAEVVGTPFYLMERLHGRVFADAALPGLGCRERGAIYGAMAAAQATLHSLDWRALGLEGYGREAGYLERQLARWSRQWALAKTQPNPALDELFAWLAAHRPAEGPTVLVHGDFRLNNLMFHPTQPQVIAVLDWELSTLGDARADLAFSAAVWRATRAEFGGLHGLDLAALGLPDEAAYLAQYRAAGGDMAGLTPFHYAFAFMRWAVIFEGIAARAAQGNAIATDATTVGALAAAMAERGIEAARAPVPHQ